MLLNEIFNTNNKVTWKTTEKGFEGSFDIDQEKYFIDADEYELILPSGKKSVLDIGFRKGKTSTPTGDNKPGRVVGSVLNGLKSKVDELKPDIVMFGALDKNGEIEKRKVIYTRIASLLVKTTSYNHLSDWFKIKGGEYAFLANFIPSLEDEQAIQALAANTHK